MLLSVYSLFIRFSVPRPFFIFLGKPQWVKISGPDEVVAGVSALYECSAICSRTCYYTWNVKGQSFPGSKFTLIENGVDTSISLACTVTDEDHKHFVSEIRSVTVISMFILQQREFELSLKTFMFSCFHTLN